MKNGNSIRLRGHHIAMLGEYFHGRNLGNFISEYGREFIEFIKNIYNEVLNKKYSHIEIVNGPDIFCNSIKPKCQSKNNNCGAIQNLPEDAEYLTKYGLKEGRNSIEKVIDAVMHYKEKTGFSSPRTEKYFMLDEFFTISA